jgi:hypothetical protein
MKKFLLVVSIIILVIGLDFLITAGAVAVGIWCLNIFGLGLTFKWKYVVAVWLLTIIFGILTGKINIKVER